MKKLSIMQDVVITLVLALWVVAGVPRLSLAQPAEPTMTAPNPDAKGQPHSNESERVQPRADQNKVGSDAAIAVEIQRRFNELESKRLNDQADSINWWLNVVLIVLGFMAVVIPIVGVVSWRVARAQFRQIEAEAQKNVITSKQHADEARSLVKEIKTKRDEAESLVGKINAETVGKDPDKAREAAEIHQAIAAAVLLQQEGKIDEAIDKWRSIASIAEGLDKELGAQAWFSIGHLSGEKADHEAAIYANTQALRLNPYYVEAYNNRGNAERALGQHQAALADYDKAIRLNPDFAAAYYHRGLANLELHQMDEARQDLEKAFALAQKAGDEALAAKVSSRLRDLDEPKDS